MAESASKYNIDDLIHLMERLRDPVDGCPWDLDQSYETIVPSTIEEAYEVADAIEKGDMDGLREELGDLLFQAVFYSQLAQEEKHFTLKEVISGLVSKLIRRHPHVFPDGTLGSRKTDAGNSRKADEIDFSVEVKQQWEEIKSAERAGKGQNSLMDDVPLAFPALLRAQKLQKRAAKVGFDWSDHSGVFDKLQEEIGEIHQAIERSGGQASAEIEEELGDLLFTCVNLTRRLGYDSETTLRKAASKFEKRFRRMESIVAGEPGKEGLDTLDSDQLEALWREAKKQG